MKHSAISYICLKIISFTVFWFSVLKGENEHSVGENVIKLVSDVCACIYSYFYLLIFFRDVPTMFSVLHPLDEPRPITSKIDGTVA